jgi:hypothetical protein
MIGRIRKELNCLPVENQHFKEIMNLRMKEHEKANPERKTILASGPASSHGGTNINPNAIGPGGTLGPFIVSLTLTETVTNNPRKPLHHLVQKAKITKLQEYLRTSLWTLLTTVSKNTNTGILKIFAQD